MIENPPSMEYLKDIDIPTSIPFGLSAFTRNMLSVRSDSGERLGIFKVLRARQEQTGSS
jgi:hypothetical protein